MWEVELQDAFDGGMITWLPQLTTNTATDTAVTQSVPVRLRHVATGKYLVYLKVRSRSPVCLGDPRFGAPFACVLPQSEERVVNLDYGTPVHEDRDDVTEDHDDEDGGRVASIKEQRASEWPLRLVSGTRLQDPQFS